MYPSILEKPVFYMVVISGKTIVLDWSNYLQKGDTLFITGGEKDVMSLAAHGFHAICFNSETVMLPPTLIYKLTFRFKHIILLYDTDKTGKESARKQEKQLEEIFQ